MKLPDASDLNDRELQLNVVVTQVLFLTVAAVGAWLFFGDAFHPFSQWNFSRAALFTGAVLAAAVLVFELILWFIVPRRWFDDGGINIRVFRNMPWPALAAVCFLVAFAEEVLFRGVLQEQFGLLAASLLFALMHFRYASKPFLLFVVVLISVSIGVVYEWSGSLAAVVTAHFIIDLVLAGIIRLRLTEITTGGDLHG
ncbi:CPBP family intramembrane glutamic endopeptidase [Alkalicoccus urumqiensis]|uniref:CPBP family intramembrane metalloprotease n=1 Tax=Alkalicoccus urumqiensis TaxID=1548213 RepID=A0A2P6MKH8_ALKUR|nr:CPBP family intramembrane glutamic endopeptidase [Alkalicoccus urumqiensis]PRO66784.1 CPBP family intramembrane metalloprotease [Alkalicoccus urumqiensis]